MDFHDTGLPADPMIYRAFTVYDKSLGGAYPNSHALRVAQTMVENGCRDSDLVAMVLLYNQPENAWGPIRSIFGGRVLSLREELQNHMKADFRQIYQATEPVKVFFMAEQAVHLQEEGGETDDISIHRKVFKDIRGTTSCPMLENQYECLLDLYERPGNSFYTVPDHEPIEVKPDYPVFEETGLLADDAVRMAYEIVTKDFRTEPENFAFAVFVAQLLSESVRNPDPATVAAALLDTCIPKSRVSDLEAWESDVGTETVSLLREGSMYSPHYAEQIDKGSPKFKLLALAISISKLEKTSAYFKMAIGTDIQGRRPDVVKVFAQVQKETLQPAIGATDAPELEEMFKARVESLLRLAESKMPKRQIQFRTKPPHRPRY